MNKEELVSLVQKIMDVEGAEKEQDELMVLLEKNILDPQVSNYIFWNKPELTAIEVIEKALKYKPIQL